LPGSSRQGAAIEPAAAEAQAEEEIAPVGLVHLSLLALMVGLLTGFGAVFFRDLIGLIHNGALLGRLAYQYDARVFTPPSPWGAFIILVPVAGSLVLTFLVNRFAAEARGHGVPEVMDAIYYQGGVIRPIVAVVKSVASAVAIGTGAAVGREGPIIQIGSALGSTWASSSACPRDSGSSSWPRGRERVSPPPSTPRSAESCLPSS
jgi:chloride channel protein, CIC family